jgi:uncharacterized protein (UPF0332 family)
MKNTGEALAHLEAARGKLASAHILLSDNLERDSLALSYFSMFHSATAVGLSEGITFPPCSRWLEAFRESLVLSGKVDSKPYSDLAEAYRLRQIADYGGGAAVPAGSAQRTIDRAAEFLTMSEAFLKTKG